jgi:hypothetical protein
MRARLVALCLGLAALGVLGISEGVARGARTASALPTVVIGSYSGIKPTVVGFSVDGGNIVVDLKWRWTSTIAVGHGASIIEQCVPNCVSGSKRAVTATVTFSRVRHEHFTKVVEVRNGQRLVDYYGHDWPEGAR